MTKGQARSIEFAREQRSMILGNKKRAVANYNKAAFESIAYGDPADDVLYWVALAEDSILKVLGMVNSNYVDRQPS